MALNFNIEPFYDDYDETKKFYRILFRPGYAVQARELTQLQTILQQQIKRHGDHIFKNGAMVIPGQISYDANTAYVKLTATLPGTGDATSLNISTAVGKVYQNTSGVQAIVLTYTPLETINGVAEQNTLFVKYIRGTGTFSANDILTPVNPSTGATIGGIQFQVFATNPIGQGTTATIQQGIYYIKDHFVLVEQQTTVVSKYSINASARVGLQVNETVVYPEEDESILDNALGSPNYSAPGAARYYINLVLTSKSYDSIVDSQEFITLLTLKEGSVQFLVDKTQYAQIEKTLARRTFDESGNYTVRDFPIQIRDYRNNNRGEWANSKAYLVGDIVYRTVNGVTLYYKCTASHISPDSATAFNISQGWLIDNSPLYNYGLFQGVSTGTANDVLSSGSIGINRSKLSLAVEPGKAYVRGYEIEKVATQYLTLNKARDSSHISPFTSRTINTSPGNYILVNSVNSLPHFLPFAGTSANPMQEVIFYDRYSASVGTIPTNGIEVARAKVKQIQPHETGGYKLFLFDMKVTAGKVFSRDAKFLYSQTGATTQTRFSAKITPTKVQIAGSLAASSTGTLTGVNTTFSIDLKVGDYVSIAGSEYRVTTVTDNDTIIIDGTPTVTAGTLIYRVETTINQPSIDAIYRIPQYATHSTQKVSYSFYKKVTTGNVTSYTLQEPNYTLGLQEKSINYIVVKADGTHLTKVDDNPSAGQYSIGPYSANSLTFTFGSQAVHDIVYSVERTYPDNSNLTAGTINKTLTSVDSESITLSKTATATATVTAGAVTAITVVDGGAGYTSVATSYTIPPVITISGGAGTGATATATVNASGVITAITVTAGGSGYTSAPTVVVSHPNGNLGTLGILENTDGFELQKVTSTTAGVATDVTDRFTFDSGVRSSHYDFASIKLNTGAVFPTGAITVSYNYLNHGDGEYYTVNSYTHTASNILYEELNESQINVIDFRPRRTQYGYTGAITPKYAEKTSFEYKAYLGRIDKLCVSTSGEFLIAQGIPDYFPKAPESPKDSMDLYTFNIEPYTFSGSSRSVVPNKIENKRYTMRDIGRLESRINNLEYYSSLSLLEQNTLNNKAYDNYGLERPQNGFMVDDFTGQGIGLVSSADWRASIDSKVGELRPFFKSTNIALLEEVTNISRTGLNYEINGDLITLPIVSKIPLVSQLRASQNESVNPFNIFVFSGTLEINPWNDTWYETLRRPDIIINDTSQYDAVVSKAEKDGVLGTVYKSWSVNWGGIQTTGTQNFAGDRRFDDSGASLDAQFGLGPESVGWARREVQVETWAQQGTKTYTGGVKTFLQSNVTDRVIEDKLVSSELIPYIRKRSIIFRGDGFKPETTMYAFFDGISVDAHIKPSKIMEFSPYPNPLAPVSNFITSVNVGSSVNNNSRKVKLSSSSVSEVTTSYTYGEVLKEWKKIGDNEPVQTGVTCVVVGQETYNGKHYAFIDNIKNASTEADATLSSDTTANNITTVYWLQGEFDTNSSRLIKKVGAVETPTSLKTTRTGQLFGTFNIPNDTTMSFRTGSRQLRFSDNAANIRANSATFADVEYTAKGILEIRERTILSTKTASVVSERVPDVTETVTQTGTRVASDTGWYDPLAQTFLVDIDGGAFITDVDLFFAQKDDNLPIKIQIRNVVNGYPGPMILPYSEVTLRSSEIAVDSVKGATATKFKFKSPVYLQNGTEYALVVISDSAKYRVWISEAGKVDVNGSGLISQQPYGGVLFKSQNASTWTAEQNQDLKFIINRAVFDVSQTATVPFVNQHVNTAVNYDVARLDVNRLVLPGTTVKAQILNVNTTANNNVEIPLEQDIEFTQYQVLKNKTDEITANSSSLKARIIMSTTKSNISPVIDAGRCSATLISNEIDNDAIDNENIPEVGSAKAKYVTKQVKLNQSATNLRILFDSNVPSTANIDVYYRTGLQSSSDFSNTGFIKVDPANPTIFTKPIRQMENAQRFLESEINLDLPDFDIVQVKLVMKSSNSSKVPRVKALRVIAYA